jgi:hypothetical protein
VIKSRRVRWAEHLSHVEGMKNEFKILVAKPERKTPLVRPRRKSKDNIKMVLKGTGCEVVDGIHLA